MLNEPASNEHTKRGYVYIRSVFINKNRKIDNLKRAQIGHRQHSIQLTATINSLHHQTHNPLSDNRARHRTNSTEFSANPNQIHHQHWSSTFQSLTTNFSVNTSREISRRKFQIRRRALTAPAAQLNYQSHGGDTPAPAPPAPPSHRRIVSLWLASNRRLLLPTWTLDGRLNQIHRGSTNREFCGPFLRPRRKIFCGKMCFCPQKIF